MNFSPEFFCMILSLKSQVEEISNKTMIHDLKSPSFYIEKKQEITE